jgi:hypothetical protein
MTPATGYAAWQAEAAAALRQHGGKAGLVPNRVWTRLYVQGLTPEEAAEQADVSAYTVHSVADRQRKKLRAR